ncbi:MAG: hypothetical protein ACYC55_06275 [Candidatus Geothermincolia bacterium]
MEEGDLIELGDLIKTRLYDSGGMAIGHLHDLALDLGSHPPAVSHIGAHLNWTDQVADLELVRPVENIVLLIPWSELASEDEEGMRLRSSHPALPAETARGKLLARRDLLNKQMVDEEGNRLQRVDEVLLTKRDLELTLAGLRVSMGWLPASSAMEKVIARLRQKHGRQPDESLIPWDAILRVDPEQVVIKTS